MDKVKSGLCAGSYRPGTRPSAMVCPVRIYDQTILCGHFWSLGLLVLPGSTLSPQVCYIVPFSFTRHRREVWMPQRSGHRLVIPVGAKKVPEAQRGVGPRQKARHSFRDHLRYVWPMGLSPDSLEL